MDGGAIAVAKPGEITTVWRREKTIFATMPGQREETPLGRGEQPWVTANGGEVWMTWVSRENGDLLLKTPNHEHPEIVAHRADDPVIGALVGETGPVVLAWESRQEKKCRLVVLVFSPARNQK